MRAAIAATVLTLTLLAGAASATAQGPPTPKHDPVGFAQPAGDSGRDITFYVANDGWDKNTQLAFDEATLSRARFNYRTQDNRQHPGLNFNSATNYCAAGTYRRVGAWHPEKARCKARVRDNLRAAVGQANAALARSAGRCTSPKSSTRRLLMRPEEHRLRLVRAGVGFALFFGGAVASNKVDNDYAKGTIIGGTVLLASLFNDYLDIEAYRPVDARAVVMLNQAAGVLSRMATALRNAGPASAAACARAVQAVRAARGTARPQVPLGPPQP